MGQRCKVFLRVVGEFGVQEAGDVVAGRCHDKGVAVRRCLGHKRCTDGTACAGLVFNDDRLAERGAEFSRDRPGQDVLHATGRKRDHDARHAGGRLRDYLTGGDNQRACNKGSTVHGFLSSIKK